MFNEEKSLSEYPKTFFPIIEDRIPVFSRDFEVIIVDDGSTDSSWNQMCELQKVKPYLKIYSNNKNMGMGAAIRSGIAKCEGDLIITMDADLTFKPEEIELLLAEYEKNPVECISGSPYLEDSLMTEVQPIRKFLSKAVNFIYHLLLDQKITSVSPIFRLYKKTIFSNLNITSNNFEVNAEILAKIVLSGFSLREVPVHLYRRAYGYSKAKTWKSIQNHAIIIGKIFKVKYLKGKWN